MFYYILPKTGTGIKEDPYKPDLNKGINFICVECREQFLIGTNSSIVEISKLGQQELENYCYNNRLNYSEIINWFVGGS